VDKAIIIIHMHKRRDAAPKVQKALTDYGCIIKTRLGIHDGILDKCSDEGLILLEVVGLVSDMRALEKKLKACPGVKTKTVPIPF
jgi:metal-responsive CopG/Arc/MetJ family transcriptional regulator